jgi:hypothetical protein
MTDGDILDLFGTPFKEMEDEDVGVGATGPSPAAKDKAVEYFADTLGCSREEAAAKWQEEFKKLTGGQPPQGVESGRNNRSLGAGRKVHKQLRPVPPGTPGDGAGGPADPAKHQHHHGPRRKGRK